MSTLNIQNSSKGEIDNNAELHKEVANSGKSVAEEEREELSSRYVDKRSCILSIVSNYSAFRRVNLAALGIRKEVIGSSITSSRILSSYTPEVNHYFPALIGLSPTSPNFIAKVKEYLGNIKIVVTDSDLRLNTTFIYNHKSDYLKIAEAEKEINDRYDNVDRSNLEELRKACNAKCTQLNELERTKYQYGSPEDINDYLMYRHCLLYNEVAKDMAFINSNSSLRVYIKDEAKELAKFESLTKERKVAMNNFAKVASSDTKLEEIYIQIAIERGYILSDAINKSIVVKTDEIMSYINTNPKQFNKFVSDANIGTKCLIERLILIGELVREPYNQRINTATGEFIGANINEAVAYFINPDNTQLINSYKAKLKMFK